MTSTVGELEMQVQLGGGNHALINRTTGRDTPAVVPMGIGVPESGRLRSAVIWGMEIMKRYVVGLGV